MEDHICTAAHSPWCRTCPQASIQGQKEEYFRELYNELIGWLGKEILTHSPGNIVLYLCSHMCLSSHTCPHWVNIQGHTHTPQYRVQCSDWVKEGYRRAGKESCRSCSGCWLGMQELKKNTKCYCSISTCLKIIKWYMLHMHTLLFP